MSSTQARQVLVLAPMPLELTAITSAFGLGPGGDGPAAPWTGQVGGCAITAVHIGMGPSRTRKSTARLLEDGVPGGGKVDHVMIVGICGGLDPDLPVGTVVSPEIVVDHSSGRCYRHRPPGDAVLRGKLVTTEEVSFDAELSHRLYAEGFVGVDMESAAVAEVCEARGTPWSVYRCISDRHFDGLLDARVVALTRPDGSVDGDALERFLAEDPEFIARLEQLGRDSERAAQLAAEAARRGCQALDA